MCFLNYTKIVILAAVIAQLTLSTKSLSISGPPENATWNEKFDWYRHYWCEGEQENQCWVKFTPPRVNNTTRKLSGLEAWIWKRDKCAVVDVLLHEVLQEKYSNPDETMSSVINDPTFCTRPEVLLSSLTSRETASAAESLVVSPIFCVSVLFAVGCHQLTGI